MSVKRASRQRLNSLGQDRSQNDRTHGFISRFAVVVNAATAIATLFLVGVGIWGIIETKHALKLSERAWFAPASGAQLMRPVEMHEPIAFLLRHQNSGREPAYDVAVAINNFTIPADNSEMVNMIDIVVPTNKSCEKLEPRLVLAEPSLRRPNPASSMAFLKIVFAARHLLEQMNKYCTEHSSMSSMRASHIIILENPTIPPSATYWHAEAEHHSLH